MVFLRTSLGLLLVECRRSRDGPMGDIDQTPESLRNLTLITGVYSYNLSGMLRKSTKGLRRLSVEIMNGGFRSNSTKMSSRKCRTQATYTSGPYPVPKNCKPVVRRVSGSLPFSDRPSPSRRAHGPGSRNDAGLGCSGATEGTRPPSWALGASKILSGVRGVTRASQVGAARGGWRL